MSTFLLAVGSLWLLLLLSCLLDNYAEPCMVWNPISHVDYSLRMVLSMYPPTCVTAAHASVDMSLKREFHDTEKSQRNALLVASLSGSLIG